jgi:hypothetical protein
MYRKSRKGKKVKVEKRNLSNGIGNRKDGSPTDRSLRLFSICRTPVIAKIHYTYLEKKKLNSFLICVNMQVRCLNFIKREVSIIYLTILQSTITDFLDITHRTFF